MTQRALQCFGYEPRAEEVITDSFAEFYGHLKPMRWIHSPGYAEAEIVEKKQFDALQDAHGLSHVAFEVFFDGVGVVRLPRRPGGDIHVPARSGSRLP